MLHDSNDKIRELMTENHSKQPVDTDQSLVHDYTDLKQRGDLMINFINVQDRFTPIRNKSVDFQPLETIVTIYKFRVSNFSMKLKGYTTWISHH